MVEKLKEWASQRGYRIAWGSESLADIVKREIADRRSESEIERQFFDDQLKSLVAAGCRSGTDNCACCDAALGACRQF